MQSGVGKLRLFFSSARQHSGILMAKTFQQMMILNLTLINIIKKVTTFTEFAGKALAYYS
jgi:hypothetical protein